MQPRENGLTAVVAASTTISPADVGQSYDSSETERTDNVTAGETAPMLMTKQELAKLTEGEQQDYLWRLWAASCWFCDAIRDPDKVALLDKNYEEYYCCEKCLGNVK